VICGSGERAGFGDGFCTGGSLLGGAGEGVGDDPDCAYEGYVDGVAGPVEVAARVSEEKGNPEQDFEADDLGCEQASGERREKSGEDGCGCEEETDGGDVSPEYLRGRDPFWDPLEQARHGDNVDDAVGDGADAVEAGEKGFAARE
jgi:hypothetical protein